MEEYGRVKKLAAWLLDLLFPPKCPFCGKVQDKTGICPECDRALPRAEGKDREQLLADKLRCVSPLWYEGIVREGILAFKFRGRSGAAEVLGEELARCAAEEYAGEFDTVTWVPVSRKRLRKRGYDQARLLAEASCRQWGVPAAELLRKTGDNPPQSGLRDPAARRANVLGMYEPAGDCTGKRILLIDDIATTGATLSECARVLRQAGAESVVCLTLARRRKGNT